MFRYFFIPFAVILLMTGCVSKKKFESVNNNVASLERNFAEQLATSDSLRLVTMVLRDSIHYLDSLLAYERGRSAKPAPPAPKKSTMTKDDEYTKKALFVYNFTKYVAWPESMPKTDKFVIGIVGDSPLMEKLKAQTAGKKVLGLPIEIRMVSTNNAADCRIVFVPHTSVYNLRSMRDKFNKHALIITEEQVSSYSSSHINMYPDDARVRYSVNKNLLEKNDLKATQDLFRYAD